MCGINGIVSINKSADNRSFSEKLKKMNDLLYHRGPDSEGTFVKDSVGFGFRRLSIIDLRETANQPMLSNDGSIVLVFNGEIYNYIELKKELLRKGYIFKTDSDTEVIINSYIEYGEQCVQRFNGMWAIAIYDFRTNKLFCSRDRLGVKPFYYCINENHLYFSSELKALHSVCNLKKANLGKVYEYLVYGFRTSDSETFLEDCFELLPGTNMVYEDNKFCHKRYWQLKENLYEHDKDLSFQEEYTQLFENAVKIRYRSDVPVALLLSGGLDSTSIAKVTDNLIEKGQLKQNDVQGFIASFPGFKDDETVIAREFVKTCRHIKLHEMQVNTRSLVEDFEKTMYDLDHPLASFTSIAHNNLMKACKAQGIKVVLNGQGSDEAYAGYVRNICGVHLTDQLLSGNGNFMREFHDLNHLNKFSKTSLMIQMIKSTLNQSRSSYLRAKYQERSMNCWNKEFVKENFNHYQSQYHFSFRGSNFNNYLLNQINHQGINNILHYEDISSMQQSIEIRSPFMDYRLMEFAFSIPNELKFKNGVSKVIQRETIGKMLPDSVTKNRKKIGFNTPFNGYIANDPFFKSYIFDILNSTSFISKKIWNADQILKVFKNPLANPKFPFWRIINLEVWSKVYGIDNLS